MASDQVVQELAITAELCGAQLTPAAARVLIAELDGNAEADLLAGIKTMRREHRGRFSLADVLEYVRSARKDRIARRKLCLWCPLEAVEGKDHCPDHLRHYDEVQAGRLQKIDPKQLTKAVFKNA